MALQTGIYRHFKGELYFAEKLVINAQTNKQTVVYHALYPGLEMGFCRELSDFTAIVPDGQNNPVQRFSLVSIVSAKKMGMFLPGSNVISRTSGTEYRVVGWKNGECLVVSLTSAHSKTEQVFIDFIAHFETLVR